MICVIDHKDTTIQYQAGCLYVKQGNRKKRTLPINQLEHLVVYGNPLVQTSVWRNLAEAAVPVIMLSSRGKPQTAMLGSGLAVRLPLRRMQHRLADIPAAATDMAKWFITRKFRGYALALATLCRRFKVKPKASEYFSLKIFRAQEQLEQALDIGWIMGVEGGIARAWFELLTKSLPEEFRFHGRNRRPPRDPINSMLSLGYIMLASEVRRAVLLEGLDPSLGFLHQDYPGREGIVLDFTEIFRSGVDDFVLGLADEAGFDESSFFYRKKDGCRLSKSARPAFFQAWAEHREKWPRFDRKNETEKRVPIRRLLSGQIAEARKYMIQLEEKYVPGK